MTAMEQIAEISCKAREAGLSYGEYIKIHRVEYSEPKANRICKTCGKEFTPPILKNGEVSKNVNCGECIATARKVRGLPPAQNYTKVYITRCASCGRKVETRRAPSVWRKDLCGECRTKRNRAYVRNWKKRRAANGNQ